MDHERTRASSRTSGEDGLLRCLELALIAGTTLAAASQPALAQERVLGFGANVYDSVWNEESFVEFALGTGNTAARRSDGSVVVWGRNDAEQCRVPDVPPGLSFVSIAVGNEQPNMFEDGTHVLALRSDGSISAWGTI